jgi:spore germination protein KC
MIRLKWWTMIAPLLCLSLLTGCWDRTEINDLAFVLAGGFDLAENGQLEATLQIALPTEVPTATSGGRQAGKKTILVVSEKGSDGADILRKLQQRLSRQIFLGQRAIIIIGETYGRHGIDQGLDQLLRWPDSRYNSYILTAHGTTAKKVLQTPYLLEAIPAIALKKMLINDSTLSVKIDDFLDAVSSYDRSPVTGAVKLSAGRIEDGAFDLGEAAVYQEDKLVGFLPSKEKEILIWWREKLQSNTITMQVEPEVKGFKGTVGVNVLKSNAHISTKLNHGMPEVTMSFKAKVRVAQNDTILDLSKAENLKRVESKLSSETEKQIKNTLHHVQKQLKSDVFGFGEEIHIRHPAYWKQNKEQWTHIYPDVPVIVKVDIRIQRVGRTQSPAHLKK